MPLLGMPFGSAAVVGPVVAKVGDYVISTSTTTVLGYRLDLVTNVTATRYYYSATKYVLRTHVVWVGTAVDANPLMASLNNLYTTFKADERSVINQKGGWA